MNGKMGNAWKIIFIGSACLLVLMGLILGGFGASKVVDYNQLLSDVDEVTNEELSGEADDDSRIFLNDSIKVDIPAAMLAALGLLTVIFVLLGCCGVIKEIRVLLGIYVPVMLVVFLILCICILVVFVSKSGDVRDKITENINLYDPDGSGSKNRYATKAVDTVQESLECCGLDSYEEWADNSYLIRMGLKVPRSCCQTKELKEDIDTCTKNPDTKAELFTPCNEALHPFGDHVGAIAIVTAIFMLINLVASCVVCAMVGG